MQKIKSGIKRLLISALFASGVVWRILDRRSSGRIIVLTYHRVLPPDQQRESFSAAGIVVSPDSFERHIRLLKARFRVLTADEAADVLAGKMACPPRACLITFDDGWWDNLAFAAPILARHQVPALLFVATDYVGGDRAFWQESASYQLSRLWAERETHPELLREAGAEALINIDAARLRPAIRRHVDALKKLPSADLRTALARIDALFRGLGLDTPRSSTDRFLSWDEVKRLVAESPFTIASHGCSHTPFPRLDQAALQEELQRSRAHIRAQTGIEVRDLAYPNGDCNDAVVAATREAGYRLAFSTQRGYARAGDDPLRLRRINIHESGSLSESLFAARLAGLS